MLNKIVITSAQFDPKIFEIEYNLNKIENLAIKASQEHQSDMIVFPEAAISGYCFKNKEEVESVAIEKHGPELSRLSKLCTKLNISIIVGAVEKEGNQLYNSVFIIEPNHILFTYRKSHLPFLGLDRFVTAGDKAGDVFETRFGKIGLLVCYELRFPETARIPALQGARIILQPTNLPQGGESHPDFLTRARACENRTHFVSCNRVGTERGFHFIGRSQIVDYNGDILAETNSSEEMITQTLDLTPCEYKDIIASPNERELYLFRHRRWDLYSTISSKPDEKGFLFNNKIEEKQ